MEYLSGADVEVTIAVVGHKSRRGMAEKLAEQLSAHLFVDESEGRSTKQEWQNHTHVMQTCTEFGTHLAVIQEDALPVDGFREHLEQAVQSQPDAILGLYLGRNRGGNTGAWFPAGMKRAAAEGHSWLRFPNDQIWHGVGLVYPSRAIPGLLAYSNKSQLGYDDAMTWANKTGPKLPVLWSVPSLVDHDDTVEPALVRKHGPAPRRRAYSVGVPPRWVDSYSTFKVW